MEKGKTEGGKTKRGIVLGERERKRGEKRDARKILSALSEDKQEREQK